MVLFGNDTLPGSAMFKMEHWLGVQSAIGRLEIKVLTVCLQLEVPGWLGWVPASNLPTCAWVRSAKPLPRKESSRIELNAFMVMIK
jgi:hypothetical protein